MANIIEREIAKREACIASKADKEAEIIALNEQIAKLAEEIDAIDVPTLEAEIEELKTYLPKDEENNIGEAY